MEEKNTLVTRSCVLSQMLDFGTPKSNSEVSKYNLWETTVYFFLENYVTSEVAISHNVLYYQQLSIAK